MGYARGAAVKVALWARVSSADQHADNQLIPLREWATGRGDTVVREFVAEDSAWQHGGTAKGKLFDKARADLVRGAQRAEYEAVLIWALDRLSRRGYGDLNGLMSQLSAGGCEVVSHEEPFIHSLGPFGEIAIHMLSMMASQESERRSQRIKAGLARRKREGKPVGGRQPGSRNRNPRPELKGEAAGWSDARRLERSRANHRRSCAPDCMETSAHGKNGERELTAVTAISIPSGHDVHGDQPEQL